MEQETWPVAGRCLAGLCLTALALWAAPSPAQTLVTDGTPVYIELPDPRSAPTTLAVAADGHVWFTEAAGNRIGRLEADGSGLVEFDLPDEGSSPRIIAIGADGQPWFTQHAGNRIGRISASGALRQWPLATADSQPRAIALGADGNLWFGQFKAGLIGRITPQGVLSQFAIPTPDSGPRAIAAGPDGNLWFSQYRGNKIGRITPQGVITEYPLPRPNAGPGDITAGPDGAMWFVQLSGGMDGLATDGNRIGRIDMAGRITEYAMPPGPESPINIAVGPDRNLWYTRGTRLGRVMLDGQITEYPLGEGVRAVGLTAGADRQVPDRLVDRLWFTDGARGRIGYLTFTPAVAPQSEGGGLAVVAPMQECAGLAMTAHALPDGTPVRVETAAVQAFEGRGYCTLKGYVAPQVRFELRLPVQGWRQRLLFTGCGGFCGQVNLRVQAAERCSAITQGEMALVTSDLGHSAAGSDTLWAAGNPQGLADYGHRAVHVVTQAARALMTRYYGQDARYRYFSGCSDGGREGVMAALRYPEDFHGIIAGAPVVDVATNNSVWHAWLVRHLSRRDGSLVFSDADLQRLHRAALSACGGTAVAMGVAAHPPACRPDLTAVGFTAEQQRMAAALYDGPVDERGRSLYFGAPPGSELTWNAQVPGSRFFASSFIGFVGSDPPVAGLDLWDLQFTRANHRAWTRAAPVINAKDPDLRAFQKAGGKLLLWHGWGDAGVPAGSTVALYQGLQQRLGVATTQQTLRLYMLPGVYHCANGPGADKVDLLSPLMRWVEQGQGPGDIVATTADGTRRRVVAPYP
jgi:streptogramin lyase